MTSQPRKQTMTIHILPNITILPNFTHIRQRNQTRQSDNEIWSVNRI